MKYHNQYDIMNMYGKTHMYRLGVIEMKKILAFTMALVAALGCMTGAFAASLRYGDVDGDNSVAINDTTAIQRHIAEIQTIDETQLKFADVDDDGMISIMDGSAIQRFLAQIIEVFPAEENAKRNEPSSDATLTPTETQAPTQEPTQAVVIDPNNGEPNEFELEVFRLTNIEREKRGLEPLEFGYFYYDCVDIRSKEVDVFFSHYRPDGSVWYSVLEETGAMADYNRYMAGENIAWGYRTPEKVVEAWMNSPDHRRNILTPEFTHLSVAIEECAEQKTTYTVVQIFWFAM